MRKTTFNKLSITNQIEYFNTQLSKGNTIQEICKSIRISYNTIRSRFRRNEYVYSKLSNKYESIHSSSPVIEVSEDLINTLIKKINHPNSILRCEKRQSSLSTRSFRIHSCVLDDFIDFCNKSNSTQQDIITQFIAEGLSKYKINS